MPIPLLADTNPPILYNRSSLSSQFQSEKNYATTSEFGVVKITTDIDNCVCSSSVPNAASVKQFVNELINEDNKSDLRIYENSEFGNVTVKGVTVNTGTQPGFFELINDDGRLKFVNDGCNYVTSVGKNGVTNTFYLDAVGAANKLNIDLSDSGIYNSQSNTYTDAELNSPLRAGDIKQLVAATETEFYNALNTQIGRVNLAVSSEFNCLLRDLKKFAPFQNRTTDRCLQIVLGGANKEGENSNYTFNANPGQQVALKICSGSADFASCNMASMNSSISFFAPSHQHGTDVSARTCSDNPGYSAAPLIYASGSFYNTVEPNNPGCTQVSSGPFYYHSNFNLLPDAFYSTSSITAKQNYKCIEFCNYLEATFNDSEEHSCGIFLGADANTSQYVDDNVLIRYKEAKQLVQFADNELASTLRSEFATCIYAPLSNQLNLVECKANDITGQLLNNLYVTGVNRNAGNPNCNNNSVASYFFDGSWLNNGGCNYTYGVYKQPIQLGAQVLTEQHSTVSAYFEVVPNDNVLPKLVANRSWTFGGCNNTDTFSLSPSAFFDSNGIIAGKTPPDDLLIRYGEIKSMFDARKRSISNPILTKANDTITWSFANPFNSSDILFQLYSYDNAPATLEAKVDVQNDNIVITFIGDLSSIDTIPANAYKLIIMC